LSSYNEREGAFIAKYSPSGAYLWAIAPSGASCIGLDLKLDASGDVCVTGRIGTDFEDQIIDFDPSPGTANFTLVHPEISYLFLAKYTASGAYLWAKIAGGESTYSRSMDIDANDNILLTGSFSGVLDFDLGPGSAPLGSLGLNPDIFVAKYNTNGEYVWAFRIGGNQWDTGYGIATDGSGNVFVTGYFNEIDVDFDPSSGGTALLSSAGDQDAFIAKYNASGTYQWAVAIGGDSRYDEGRALATDNDGNLYATGYFSGNDVDFQPGPGVFNVSSFNNGTDIYVAKYSSGGVCAWVKNTTEAEGRDIATDGDHVFVSGFFDGINIDFDPGPGVAELSTYDEDVLLWKLSSDGEYEWAIQMGLYSRNNFWDMSCRAIARDAAGNVYVTGTLEGYYVDFDPGPGEALLNANNFSDIFIAKYDAAGNYLWAKLIGGGSTEEGAGIAVDADGNIYITAYLAGSAPVDFDPGPGTALLTSPTDAYEKGVVAKYTTDGNYVWAKIIDNSIPTAIALDGSGRPYITGYFYGTDVDFDPGPGSALLTSPGDYNYDVFIVGFNTDGTFNWAKGMGGTQNDYATGIAIGADGSIHITGYFDSADADFDPTPGIATLASAGFNDIFVAKYNSIGEYQWAHRTGGAENDAANSVTLDAVGNVYVTGEFMGADINFDPGAGATLLSSAGNSDIFVAKFTASGSLVWASRQGGADYADRGLGIAIDAEGLVYIAGDFDDANTPQSESDVFISQFDAGGNSLLVSGSGAVTYCIAASGDGQVVTGGTFQGTRDFDPGPGAVEFTAVSTAGDMFFAQYSFAPTEITVSGTLIWENDDATGVGNATVTMSGDQSGSVTTVADGMYSFTVTPGSDLTITPTKTINKFNGVTTADATRIQRHVANIELITDPYKIVAADVNKSNTVTTQDASTINQALLGNPSALNQFKTSWRFVRASHNLNIPPWGFPENIALTDVNSNLENQNFIGIKTGDVVAPSTNPANLAANQPFVLNAPDLPLESGAPVTVVFSANQFADLAALQFALKFDVEKLAFVKIELLAGLPLSEENLGTYNISEGEINVAWAQAEGVFVEEAAPVFKLTFNVLETGGNLSEALQLADEVLESHAYTSVLADNKVALHFFGTTSSGGPIASSKLELLQNRPNPFVNQTTIGFVLPESCEATLRILDGLGREILHFNNTYPAGHNNEIIHFEKELPSGVFYCELLTPFGTRVLKMVHIER